MIHIRLPKKDGTTRGVLSECPNLRALDGAFNVPELLNLREHRIELQPMDGSQEPEAELWLCHQVLY